MPGKRAVVGLIALGCLLGTIQPSKAVAAAHASAASMASYDASSGGTIQLDVDVVVHDRPGIVVLLYARRDSQGRVLSLEPNVWQFDASSGLRVWTPAGESRQCPSDVVCRFSPNGGIHLTATEIVPRGTPLHLAIYAAALGTKVTMSWQRVGPWRTRALRAPRAAAATAADTYGTSVNGFGAQVYTGSVLREPSRSSVAVGILPCSTDSVASAVGYASLSGGRATTSSLCPNALAAAVADHSTTWRFSGVAGGLNNTAYRLVSLSLL